MQFGQPQNQNPYEMPGPIVSRKKLFLMFGSGILLLIIVAWLFFGSQPKPGAADMQDTVQNTAESLGIIDEFEDKLQYSPTQNDIALVKIILRGNYQNLNELYNKTYKPKKKFSENPKPDTASQTTLEAAARNNVLDSEIVTVLKPKISAAKIGSLRALGSFSKKDSVHQLKTANTDFQAIEDILNRPR